ncbi:MAG: tetratricopeptide repeat protein [Pirellulaceae bacterium]
MKDQRIRNAILLRYYRRYLNDCSTPQFIASVAQRYSLGTLERLSENGELHTKRAAGLALGLLGDERCIGVLGPLLTASDRKLRLVVDDAMRAISAREGSPSQRQTLELVVRSNECGTFEKSVELASEIIDSEGGTAELYHQRSLAFFQIDSVEHAIADCQQVLERNSFHYGAMIGLGHCHLEMGDLLESLTWLRGALAIFPDLEPVRVQVRRLERAIQEL